MFEKLKKFPLIGFIYNLPGVARLYHFLLALLGAAIHGYPDTKIFVIGVTGTKGKTTTLEILNAILEGAGKTTALLSSLRIKIGEHSDKNLLGNTMPGRFFIRRFLKRAVKAGCRYALVEVTSQGVAMHRHRFIAWNLGILTNIAPEHIEAHGSFEHYRAAKLEFLKYVLRRGGEVFINGDDKNSRFFIDEIDDSKKIIYSKNDSHIVPIINTQSSVRGAAEVHRDFVLSDFNKDNIAAAAAVALDLGIDEKTIMEALHSFGGVPGRMEFLRKGPFTVVVDYAHTPDSLEAVYKHLRFLIGSGRGITKKLVCVLGAAGGGRDKWKRPAMGRIAAEYCDEVILTDEDPYDEKPEEIVEQVASGAYEFKPPSQVIKILDRRSAIEKAVGLLNGGDVAVITGKGSEDFIHVARGKKIPWSEKKVAEEILNKKHTSS